MIRINIVPEKVMSDEVLFRILQDVCSAKDEEKIAKLRKLLEAINVKKDFI